MLHQGQACPVSRGTVLNTPETGPAAFALGTGPVRPLGANADGTMSLISNTSAPGWLSAKMLLVSTPDYQGPFLVRLQRLDTPGPVGLDEHPGSTSLFTPAGPTAIGTNGYRFVTGATGAKAPGCVAWQVDGLTFSDVIVANLVCRQPTCTQPPKHP